MRVQSVGTQEAPAYGDLDQVWKHMAGMGEARGGFWFYTAGLAYCEGG